MAVANDSLLCWVSILSDIANVLFGIIFIPLLIFKFFESHRQSINIRTSIKYITIGFFSISTVVPLAWILFRAESCDFYPFDSLPKLNKHLTAIVLIVVLVTHKVLFHVYMLLRLHQTFKNTSHAIGWKVIACYGLAFVIEIMCQLIFDFNEVYPSNAYFEWTIFVYMALDVILCFSLITMFNRKVFHMIVYHKETGDTFSSYDAIGDTWEDFGAYERSRSVILTRELLKQSLLCTVAIVSRLIVDLFILGDEIKYHPVWNINLFFIIRKLVTVVVICLQILCIYLSFHFSEGAYRCCCYSLHSCCQKRTDRCAEKKVDKEMSKQASMGNYFRL